MVIKFSTIGLESNFFWETVLNNVPIIGEPIESSNLQWSENFGINNFGIKEFSSGAIAGIVIGVLLFTFFAIFVLWRYIPATKDIAKYTHRYFITNSR